MKRRYFFYIAAVFIHLLASAAVSPAQELTYERYQFKPYITLEEKYTSNVNRIRTDKKDDYITTAYPGFRITGNDPVFGVDMDVHMASSLYARNSQYNYTGYDGHINLRYNPDPALTFKLRDNAIKSENPRYRDYAVVSPMPQYLAIIQQGRFIYTQNHLEPSVDWQFSRLGNVGFTYNNSIYRNERAGVNESTNQTYSPRLSYGFNEQNGILIDYSYIMANHSVYSDLKGHTYHGRYTYKFDPRLSTFADYSFSKRDYDSGTSYNVHSPTAGIEHSFNPTLTGLLQLGYYYSDPSTGKSHSGLSSTLKLTQSDRQTTYSIALESGFREFFYATQGKNQNFAQYYGAIASVSHKPVERCNISLSGSVRNVDYVYGDRKDWIYSVDLHTDYQILKWLSIFGKVGFWSNDISINSGRNDEFHAIIGLTATYL